MLDEQRRGIINQATCEFGMQENEAANAIYIYIYIYIAINSYILKYRVGILPTIFYVAANYVFLLNYEIVKKFSSSSTVSCEKRSVRFKTFMLV